MPVFPDVGSMIVPPGFSLPERSASSIIARAMRSLIDPPGLARSDFIHTSARSPNSRLILIVGVLPMVSRIFAAFMGEAPSLCGAQIGWFEAFCKAQLREPPGPQENDRDRANAARDHCGDRADHCAKETGFRLSELVGSG